MTDVERHRGIAVNYTAAVHGTTVVICKRAFMNLYAADESVAVEQ